MTELSDFKKDNPFCCYCGGKAPTEQLEHAPPKILFKDKWRPDQLIVPACDRCNKSFAQTDQIVAFLTRATRSWTSVGLDADRLKSMLELGIGKHHRDLLEEWGNLSFRQIRRLRSLQSGFRNAPALNFGPLTQRQFQAFGARLAFALHYNHTKRIIPPNGGAIVEIKTLQHRLNGWRLPDDVAQLLGPPRTLAQGKKELSDQFVFACGPNAPVTLYFATFGMDYALVLFVAEDCDNFSPDVSNKSHVHTPGDFHSYPVPYRLGPVRFEFSMSS